MRTRKLALVATAGLATMTLLTAAPALAATKPTTPASAVQAPNGVKFDPSKAKCSAVPGASASTKNCIEIERLPLSDLTATQLTQRKQAMAKLSAKGKQAQAAKAPAAAAAAPAECGFPTNGVPTGVFALNPSRLLSCSDFFYDVLAYEEVDGVFSIVGDFSFEDQSWVTFSATSLTWVHDMQTISYGGDGVLADGVNGFMSSNCTAVTTACTATSTGAPDPQVVFLAPDSTYSWEWDEQDAGPASATAGTEDTLDAVLGVNWDLDLPGTNDVENETGGLDGRCDNGDTGDGTAGCVDEKFIPTLYLSYALYGASVDMVNFAANNIPPYYGNEFSPTPTPLHRLASKTQQTANRGIVCDGSFTEDAAMTAALAPYTTNPARPEADSCDEYPFAGTYESGAMQTGADGQPKPFVTTGADCWQGTAVQNGSSGIEPADWTAMVLDSTSTSQCIRAHIPRTLNTNLGGAYGRFVQKQRLLDKDAFWVWATA
ncbi:MAG TPA: hypothetical protein VGG54_31100 [Trebonia sp.]